MNILFLTENEISPMQGGTERITKSLSESLMNEYGCECSSIYRFPTSLPIKTDFTHKERLDEKNIATQLDRFYKEKKIDVVICNYVSHKSRLLINPTAYRLAKENKCKFLMCYHAMPGEDMIGNSFSNSWFRITNKINIVSSIKDILLNITPSCIKNIIFSNYYKKKYRFLYDHCDKLVLLSEKFYEPYAKIAKIKIDEKFKYLNNALSYTQFATNDDIESKAKEVLIISRLDDKVKRISLALKIWKKVEENEISKDWHLNIIGGGIDETYLKKIASKLDLKRVSFLGRQEDIVNFYKRSSIFMMTSIYEGWGLTLTEAQQFGVVPIAFNTYASITDIISDGNNGYIVEDMQINDYASKICNLMTNESIRKQMSKNSIESSKRYTQNKITLKLLEICQS